MLVLSRLVVLSAYANLPDLQVDAIVRPSSMLSGRLAPDGLDVLVWVEQDSERLYASEYADGQLVTRLVAEDVSSLTTLADYDGDGWTNIITSLGGGVVVDIETGQAVDIFPICGGTSTGDVNGDGLGDYATHNLLWPGQAGGFREGAAFVADDTETCREVFAVGDLDADGREDLVRANLTNPYYPYGQLSGAIALWLDPTRRDGVGPSLPVLEDEPPTETPRGCGCQSAPGTSYTAAALLAALLATSGGRRWRRAVLRATTVEPESVSR